MPLTNKEKTLRRKIVREYKSRGYSSKRANKIANAVIYSRKIKVEEM